MLSETSKHDYQLREKLDFFFFSKFMVLFLRFHLSCHNKNYYSRKTNEIYIYSCNAQLLALY